MPAPTVSDGGCCPVHQTMYNYTVVPVGLLRGPVDGRLSSVNGDGIKLNSITGKLPVSSNLLPVLLKNGFNIPKGDVPHQLFVHG